MNKKTKIEWLRDPATGEAGFSINPVKGLCPMACSYCYARAMYKRFKWNPEIRWEPQVFRMLDSLTKPSRIFVGSAFELFLPDDERLFYEAWLYETLSECTRYPQHTFIFLTKQPQNLIKWSPFPENCWVGVTATDTYMAVKGLQHLDKIKANRKFMSFEPLLSQTCMTEASLSGLDWLIIGQQTPIREKTQPKIEWIQEIVQAADKARVPIFLKDNLRPIIETLSATEALPFYDTQTCDLRQEYQCF